jgi:hypothetical protein
MNPRAAAAESGMNGDRYASMPWDGVAKAAAMTILKGGPLVAIFGLVLWGLYVYLNRGLDVQEKQISVQVRQIDIQERQATEQAKATTAYREYVEAAKKSDAYLADSMVLAMQRIEHQDLVLAELRKQGTEPAREMLTLMKSATDMMADVPASRKRTEALLERIAKAHESGGTQ